MKREIYLLSSGARFNEFLGRHSQQGDSDEIEAFLGIGFYSSLPAGGSHPGINLSVTPPFLKRRLLDGIGQGNLSPFESDIIFVGDVTPEDGQKKASFLDKGDIGFSKSDTLAVSSMKRWILAGVQPLSSEDQGRTGREKISMLLARIFTRVMELRPACAVFVLDVEILGHYFEAREKGSKKELPLDRNVTLPEAQQAEEAGALQNHVLSEVLTWLIEENVHPKVCLLTRNASELEELMNLSRRLSVQPNFPRNVRIRL